MTRRVLSRRRMVSAGLVGLLCPVFWAKPSAADAIDAASLRFRGIVVDARRVKEFGGAALAAQIERQLKVDAANVFADRVTPTDLRAPQLVIRIDSLQLAAYAGDSPVFQQGSANTDYLEGAGLVVLGGSVLSTTPILSALDASYSGAWYLPMIDERRVASISYHFASWLRRQMGL